MADKTGIEWTDATWNPIRGCSRVSEGCRNCYAEGVAKRFSGPGLPYEGLIAKGGQWNGEIKLVPEQLNQPLRWSKPRRIFVNSMSDLFHENVPYTYIDKVFAVMAMAHWHTFQVLTKRPDRMVAYFADIKKSPERGFNVCSYFSADDEQIDRIACIPRGLPNVWLGVSVEDQATADERIPLLLQTPAAVRWISAEPLLGPVDLTRLNYAAHAYEIDALNAENNDGTYYEHTSLDWVVVGGESGRSARPMLREWARSLRDQCQAAGVPFLFKQWGEWAPNWYNDDNGMEIPGSIWMDRMGKKMAGRTLDGILHDEYPEAQR